jgi:hypothetical protein
MYHHSGLFVEMRVSLTVFSGWPQILIFPIFTSWMPEPLHPAKKQSVLSQTAS